MRQLKRSALPVCGKRTYVLWHDEEIVLHCIRDKGHSETDESGTRVPDQHLANVTWKDQE